MIYVTGDTHGDFHRFSYENFSEQNNMTRDDFVLIAGDFGGIWTIEKPFPLIDEDKRQRELKKEKDTLKWFETLNPTFCFVLGNHENYNRYDSGEFPVVDFHGGKAQQLADNVFHLMSGYVFELCGKTVFTFDGAASLFIIHEVLDRGRYHSDAEFYEEYLRMTGEHRLFRVKDLEWWERETRPTEEEKSRGLSNLAEYGNKVDFILTHCLPQSIASYYSNGVYKPNEITEFLDVVNRQVQFGKWFCGHYHEDRIVLGKYHIVYQQIMRLSQR